MARPFGFSGAFIPERCDFCGKCLNECPELALPLDHARDEFRNMVEGRPSRALDGCTGCMACNSICPTDAEPHTLILTRWRERYEREGLPAVAALVLPYQQDNLFRAVLPRLPEDERALVAQWETNVHELRDVDTAMYAGCNMLLQPFLLDSPLFANTPIFGSLDICCAEPFYRLGCWDAAKVAAGIVKETFARIGMRRVIVPCLAGYHLFTRVYPAVFGIDLGCEIVSVEEWLLERIERGGVHVRPLGLRAAVHDNCWPKASGDVLFDTVRRLLAAIGVDPIDPPHARERALCCGMCAAAARYSLLDVLRVAKRRNRELQNTDADAVIDYCGGCNWLLSLVERLSLSNKSKPRYHILELVQAAAGETPKRRSDDRARLLVSAMWRPLVGRYFSRKRFWIDMANLQE